MAELSDIRDIVRERYAAAARRSASGAYDEARALESESGCCGSDATSSCCPADHRGVFGGTLYDEATGAEVPEAAINASLGCGVPTAVADLHEGEIVLDLGSGAGADVLISARRVGPAGKAIGVDMTDEMLELARENARAAGVDNVEFVKGYLEDMPLEDESVDVVISNCVINLSGDKPTVLREAARVLRPGGRFAVSDVIADPDMDEATKADMAAWTGCVAGALTEDEFRVALTSAGLGEIEIRETHRVHEHAAAAIIRARKPAAPAAGESAVVAGCALDASGVGSQLTRYRRLAEHADSVERLDGELVVWFSNDLPVGLLEQTLEVERRCCPFIHTTFDPIERRLVITVETVDQVPSLDSLFLVLS